MVEDVREVIAKLIVTSGRPVVHAFLVHEHQLVCRHLFHPQGEAGERVVLGQGHTECQRGARMRRWQGSEAHRRSEFLKARGVSIRGEDLK